jgi:hypothetical protein
VGTKSFQSVFHAFPLLMIIYLAPHIASAEISFSLFFWETGGVGVEGLLALLLTEFQLILRHI